VKIQDILFRNAILIDLKARPKNDLLTQMAEFLSSIYNLKDPKAITQKILERELEVSTGIGYGIAIPHTRTNLVEQLCIVAGRCVKGIEFDSLDEQPVHLIFMLASPEDNSDNHRTILSSISKIMSYEDMREKLLSATTSETFLNHIIDGENKYIKQ
jgi:fructose-specific phosphotransferase system IIA component